MSELSVWYENAIEEPIRPLVMLLRDNGYNTISSCGHEMYVECDYYKENLTELHDLLFNNGYRQFKIFASVSLGIPAAHSLQKCLVVWLPKADGEFSERSKI